MWLEAVLTARDIAGAFTQMTPLRIALGREGDVDRYLFLGQPRDVELIPDVGVRFETRAKLRWSLAQVRVPLTLRRVGVRLTPKIVHRDGQDSLVFGVELEELDVSLIPAFVDRSILGLVNGALAQPGAEMKWAFMETLDFNFGLPEALQPARKLALRARWGEVRVTKEALVLAVSFATSVEKEKCVPRPGAAQATQGKTAA